MIKKLAFISLLVILIGSHPAFGHVGNQFLPKGCGSCHMGHGMSGQPMLDKAEEELCYKCHGSDAEKTGMISEGKLAVGAPAKNIKDEFAKIYRHPVAEGVGHSANEKLPSYKSSSVQHAECADCHNPHERIYPGEKQTYEVAGLTLSGQYTESSMNEYEICMKCHSQDVAFDMTRTDLTKQFSLSAISQHPVTQVSKSRTSKSLIDKVSSGPLMKCSDCHTNDDPNGPRGPHGSNHKYMLSGNYDTDKYGEESSYSYEFCYSCHDSSSILSNESFPLHKEHIEGDPFREIPGTSCFTCHSAHGSQNNQHLIDFNPNAVTRDSNTGLIRYQPTGIQSGECYLNCHNHNHSPGKY